VRRHERGRFRSVRSGGQERLEAVLHQRLGKFLPSQREAQTKKKQRRIGKIIDGKRGRGTLRGKNEA